jgi:thiamine biosynthesis lipoprotein
MLFGMMFWGDNLKKLIVIILLLSITATFMSGCGARIEYEKYTDTFFDSFDTITQVVGYAKSEEEFKAYADDIHDRMLELHKLYDKYNSYEGINNIKTINEMAGKEPVVVQKELLDLIIFSKEMNEKTSRRTNIAFGAVLSIWSRYRDEAEGNPSSARIPPIEELKAAKEFTDINKVIVDVENSTIFLEDPKMSLDVGAVAKGFATEIVAQEMKQKGFGSFIVSAGGNIRAVGKPLDEVREKWGVGIQNPDKDLFGDGANTIETIFVNDASVVSSGDYQRYYMVGDKRIHHIIDPETLMPADHYRAVNVVIEDSGLADFYSTEVFLLPYEESRALVDAVDGLEAIWVFADGTIEMSEGFKDIALSNGASATDK